MKHPTWHLFGKPERKIPYNPDNIAGYLPIFLDEDNPQGAWEQLDANYRHGGGLMEMNGFRTIKPNFLLYPGDPPFRALAETRLRDERIILYEAEIVCVFQPDGTHKCSRMS